MKVYIASSWKNVHAVQMLTDLLRKKDIEVLSFVENSHDEWEEVGKVGFEEWVHSDGAKRCFEYDTQSAMNCDLLIYISPSGKDAAAEVGMAYAKGIPIIGLWAKGEDFGLMRKVVKRWFENHADLLDFVHSFHSALEVA